MTLSSWASDSRPSATTAGRQMRPIARLRRRDRGHRRRLHEPGRMRLRSGNADRLKSVVLIERLGDPAALRRRPVDGLIGEFDGRGFDDRRSGTTWRSLREGRGRVRGRPRSDRRAARAGRQLQRQPRRDELASPSRAAWPRRAPCRAKPGTPSGSSAGMRSMTVSRVSMRGAVPGIDARRRWRRRTRRGRVPASRTKPSRQAGLSGERLAPVMATRRPPSASARQRGRDMAERRVGDAAVDMGERPRMAGSSARRSAARPASRWSSMCAASKRVTATPGNRRSSRPARVSASSFRTRRRAGELGEDGEQARCRPKARARRSAGVIAAAVLATKPSAIGVENCWSAWLSSERRVCDGSSAATLASMASSAAGDPARARMARPNLRRNRTVRRLAGVVGGLPVPAALGVGAAEGCDPSRREAPAHRSHGRVRDRRAASRAAATSATPASGCETRARREGQPRLRPRRPTWNS